jgi:hypothetical protein
MNDYNSKLSEIEIQIDIKEKKDPLIKLYEKLEKCNQSQRGCFA